MSRRTLAVSALLAASVACRDSPTAIPSEARVKPQPTVGFPAPPHGVRAAREALVDPFVGLLVRQIGDPEVARHLSTISEYLTQGPEHGSLAVEGLAEARAELEQASSERTDEGADQLISRTALLLILDRADELLRQDILHRSFQQ